MGVVQTNSDDDGSSSVDLSKRNLEKLFVGHSSCSKVDDPVLNTDGWVEEGGKVADVVRSQVYSFCIAEGLQKHCKVSVCIQGLIHTRPAPS